MTETVIREDESGEQLATIERLAAIRAELEAADSRLIYYADVARIVREDIPWLLAKVAARQWLPSDEEVGRNLTGMLITIRDLSKDKERLLDLLTRVFMLREAGAWVETPGFPETGEWLREARAVLSRAEEGA